MAEYFFFPYHWPYVDGDEESYPGHESVSVDVIGQMRQMHGASVLASAFNCSERETNTNTSPCRPKQDRLRPYEGVGRVIMNEGKKSRRDVGSSTSSYFRLVSKEDKCPRDFRRSHAGNLDIVYGARWLPAFEARQSKKFHHPPTIEEAMFETAEEEQQSWLHRRTRSMFAAVGNTVRF